MKHNKIGSIFLMSVLALAGIGISYAGFSDSISVYGTVDTATVDITVVQWYSGTDVWKVYAVTPGVQTPPGEIVIWSGFLNDPARPTESSLESQYPGCEADLISWSYAAAGTSHGDPAVPYDVDMVYHNLFPCIDFSADFIFHYDGSIPAKINLAEIYPIDDPSGFLSYLWNYHSGNPGYGAWVEAYRCYPIEEAGKIIGWNIDYKTPVDIGYQLHLCNYVYVKLVIHLPQVNKLQGLSGTFGGTIGVIQWNDACAGPK